MGRLDFMGFKTEIEHLLAYLGVSMTEHASKLVSSFIHAHVTNELKYEKKSFSSKKRS